ncbi:MAG: PspC domain-containing protein [Dehalococcoidia bacterium]|jgi:phage shock protein C|nr:PspC domain-containing protein [Dehalococcoidia bacterium]
MNRLERSNTDKFVFGVCGGLAANLDVDPVLIRVAFVILGVATAGTAIVVYLLLAILMPPHVTGDDADSTATDDSAPDTGNSGSDAPGDISSNLDQLRHEAAEAADRLKVALSRDRAGRQAPSRNRQVWGIIVIVFGVLLLGGNLGWYGWFGLGEWWPVLLVAAGVALIAINQRNPDDNNPG